MFKAGAIAGAAMFVMVLILAAGLSPVCAVCAPLFTGLLAGYLTGVFEKDPQTVIGRGAGAGAIAGAIAIVAQLAASVFNAYVIQNPENQLNSLFGMPPTDPTMVWIVQLGVSCVVGLVNLGLAAGLGAAGGAIWKGSAGKNVAPPGPSSLSTS